MPGSVGDTGVLLESRYALDRPLIGESFSCALLTATGATALPVALLAVANSSLPRGSALRRCTQGVWPAGAQHFTDINACARTKRGDWREDECVLATVDDFGAVKLFKYPSDVGRVRTLINLCVGHHTKCTLRAMSRTVRFLVGISICQRKQIAHTA